MPDVKLALSTAWAEAQRCAPSVLVLDRLHLLAPKALEGPHAGSPADTQAWVIADHIDDLITRQGLVQVEAQLQAAEVYSWLGMSFSWQRRGVCM